MPKTISPPATFAKNLAMSKNTRPNEKQAALQNPLEYFEDNGAQRSAISSTLVMIRNILPTAFTSLNTFLRGIPNERQGFTFSSLNRYISGRSGHPKWSLSYHITVNMVSNQ
jgi:hypothetical protein